MSHAPHPGKPAPRYGLALLAYLGLTLLVFAPVLPHFADAIGGGPVARRDGWQNIWNLWWALRALASFQDPFFTRLLYYPTGIGLHLQTLNLSNGILMLPITALFGPVAGFNAASILAFVLTGLGGYALALRVSESRAASFVGGLALTFSPFHMTKLWDGQLEMIALQWAPFYALFLLRAVEDRHRRDALLAGLFLALIGYTSWYYFLFFAIFSVLFALVWLVWLTSSDRSDYHKDTKIQRDTRERHTVPGASSRLRDFVVFSQPARLATLTQLALAGIVGAALLLPILIPSLGLLLGSGEGDGAGPDVFDDMKVIHSADLVDFFLPSALHPLWGQAITQVGESIHQYVQAWNIGPGFLTLGLALCALFLRREQAWRWWLIALSSIVLALGPLLQIGGMRTSIPLPYALLAHVPGVDIAHRPNHFVVIAVVLFAPLVALGLAAILERLPVGLRHPVFGLALMLMLFELAPPILPLDDSRPHPYYQQIARAGGGVIDLPPRLESSEPLESQLIHGLPVMGGYVSRTPSYPFGFDVPYVRDLWAMQELDRRLVQSGPDDPLVVLNDYGLRHVIIHWVYFKPEQRAQLEKVLALTLPGVEPAYQDAELSAYLVPQVQQRPIAYVREGWYGEEQEGQRRWRWMGERGELVIYNPTGQPASVTLALTAQSYTEESPVELSYMGAGAGRWLVQRADTSLTISILAPPGESSLWLHAPAVQETNQSGRALSIVLTSAAMR